MDGYVHQKKNLWTHYLPARCWANSNSKIDQVIYNILFPDGWTDAQMNEQMDEGQQHQGGSSPPPLAHFFPIRKGGKEESCILEGIFFQMLFSSYVTTYLAREKISKWQQYQQKRSAGRWTKGNGETIHKDLKERFALSKSKQRSSFPQPSRRLPSVPRLSWLTMIIHSSLKSIREYSLCFRYYAWCDVCRWQDRGTVLLKCAVTWRHGNTEAEPRSAGKEGCRGSQLPSRWRKRP